MNKTDIGTIALGVSIIAIIVCYLLTLRSARNEAKRFNNRYPSARKLTRAEREKICLRSDVLDGKLMFDESDAYHN